MAEQINVTQDQVPPPRPTVVTRREGPGLWVILGALIGGLVILLLVWAFWLQPSYFPQVQVLSVPQSTTAPTVVAPTAPAPDINVQGGSGGGGGTGGTGSGGTGGTGTGGTGTSPSTPSSTTP